MDAETKMHARELMFEVSNVDPQTLELKKEIQHIGCPFCGTDNGSIIDSHQTRQALFYSFKKCNTCSLIYPSPRPNQAIIENGFRSDDFSEDSKRTFEILISRARKDSDRSALGRLLIKA